MKKNYTDITILVDRSGSMADIKNDMEGGLQQFLKEQCETQGDLTVSLFTFDNYLECNFIEKKKDNIDFSNIKIIPRGWTALLDSLKTVIDSVGIRLSEKKEIDRPDNVIFLIVTDGLENASTKTTRYQIAEMIKHQQEKYNWKFIFLGANQDAVTIGSQSNISPDLSMTFNSSSLGINNLFQTTSCMLKCFRCGAVSDMSFSTSDRENAMK